MTSVNNNSIRIRTREHGDTVLLTLDIREPDGAWRTLLGNGTFERETVIQEGVVSGHRDTVRCPDPELEWSITGSAEIYRATGFFSEHGTSDDPEAVVLTGRHHANLVEMTLRPLDDNCVYVSTRMTSDAPTMRNPTWKRIGKLMTHLFFIPDGRADRWAEPVDFAWMPNLHRTEQSVCGDHFFRSPAVMLYADGLYAALVPDLDVFSRNCVLPHALDLRTFLDPRSQGGAPVQAPRLSYGICTCEIEPHIYTRHDRNRTVPLLAPELCYGFYLFLGRARDASDVAQRVTTFLWNTYGHRYFEDIRPQVLPFEEYGRRYTYVHELPRSVKHVNINGSRCTGIYNGGRGGASFGASDNDLSVGFGVKRYGQKWRDEDLSSIADGILELSLQAPRNHGAFACVYNFDTGRYDGTPAWPSICAKADGYDAASMGVTTWLHLYWHEHFDPGPAVLESATAYAHFLMQQQLPSGAIPAIFFKDLTPAKQLKHSAITAIGGAVLGKVAKLTGDKQLKAAALRAGRFVEENIIPQLLFNDYECYYSCSPKPLHAIDYWSGIRPHSTLSLQWSCDQMLSLHRLTGDPKWLQHGEYLLSILSLYQQVWNPAHRSGYLYGGFGVMNTDGEWSDGRQARFVPTYADYYLQTSKAEYLERAVAACRASFALMDMPQNHENDINRMVLNENLRSNGAAGGQAQPGMGYAGENIHHAGEDNHFATWSCMNWSSGGGLGASAYLDILFGSVWVDGTDQKVIPIDGVKAHIVSWDGNRISLEVESALKDLKAPYLGKRELTVKFGRLGDPSYLLTLNGNDRQNISRQELENGITL